MDVGCGTLKAITVGTSDMIMIDFEILGESPKYNRETQCKQMLLEKWQLDLFNIK